MPCKKTYPGARRKPPKRAILSNVLAQTLPTLQRGHHELAISAAALRAELNLRSAAAGSHAPSRDRYRRALGR